MASEIAVLMGAYNSEATIQRAVSSLTGGTYPCDIYIVDDGSRVPVSEVLGKIPNVEIIRLAKNGGIARASNVGLRNILQRGYKYIAKMDADDVSYPDRLAKQVAFLDRHPDIAVVGAWGRDCGESTGDAVFINRTPEKPDAVMRAMYFNSAMINTSAMIRADVFRSVGLYSVDYPAAEDYEMYRRISKQYALANLPEVLIDIYLSDDGISLSNRHRQVYDRLRIQIKYFAPLQWRAWAGVLKTLLLLVVPWNIVRSLKVFRENRFGPR